MYCLGCLFLKCYHFCIFFAETKLLVPKQVKLLEDAFNKGTLRHLRTLGNPFDKSIVYSLLFIDYRDFIVIIFVINIIKNLFVLTFLQSCHWISTGHLGQQEGILILFLLLFSEFNFCKAAVGIFEANLNINERKHIFCKYGILNV